METLLKLVECAKRLAAGLATLVVTRHVPPADSESVDVEAMYTEIGDEG